MSAAAQERHIDVRKLEAIIQLALSIDRFWPTGMIRRGTVKLTSGHAPIQAAEP